MGRWAGQGRPGARPCLLQSCCLVRLISACARGEDQRGEQQPLHADAEQRRVRLLVVACARARRGRAGCAAARGASSAPPAAIATTSANISSIASAGRTSTRTRASSSPALAKRVHDAGRDLDDVARAGEAPCAGRRGSACGRRRPRSARSGSGGRAGSGPRRRGAARSSNASSSPPVVAAVSVKVKRSPVTGFSSVWPGVIMAAQSIPRCVRLSMAGSREFMRERLRSAAWTPSPDCSTGPARAGRSCCARRWTRRGRCGSRTRRR